MDRLPLALTQDETRLIHDRLVHGATPEKLEPHKELVILLGSAFLELMGDRATEETATLFLREEWAWTLLTLFKTADRTDRQQMLGIQVLRKLYRLLAAWDDRYREPGLADLEVVGETADDQSYDTRAKVIHWPDDGPRPVA